MPNAYVQKMATKHKISIDKAEEKWQEAKEAADKSGHKNNPNYYAVVTKIFQNMLGEEHTTLNFRDWKDANSEGM